MNKMQTSSSDAARPRRLGRGLNSLLSAPVAVEIPPPAAAATAGPGPATPGPATPAAALPVGGINPAAAPEPDPRAIVMIPVEQVVANRFQPRRSFDEASLRELAASIRAAGVVQPILVRIVRDVETSATGSTSHKMPGRGGPGGGPAGSVTLQWYELVAGERRWRAASLAGLKTVPAVIAELTDEQAAEWALIENVQRVDLGAMEQAYAIRQLVDRFGLTHQQAADKLGMDRATVTNLLRLTTLEPEVLELLERGTARATTTRPGAERDDGSTALDDLRDGLSAGHGKVLLSMKPGPRRVELARQAAASGWSVRKLASVAGLVSESRPAAAADPAEPRAGARRERTLNAGMRELEKQLSDHLGTKVELRVGPTGKRGAVVVKFFDLDQFDGLMAKMGFVMK
jgi:ParB family chromosome partitioning protein